jgi:hypothetical protein
MVRVMHFRLHDRPPTLSPKQCARFFNSVVLDPAPADRASQRAVGSHGYLKPNLAGRVAATVGHHKQRDANAALQPVEDEPPNIIGTNMN